jgi:mRNA-degrading endonuclease toxin of MazEF toxin-antitoxin module
MASMTTPQQSSPCTYPRGTLVNVKLDGVGREPGSNDRPLVAVIVSSNTVNAGDRIAVVVPVRPLRGRKPYVYESFVPKGTCGLIEDHVAVPPQVRSIDVKKRILTPALGTLDPNIMAQIGVGLFAVLGGLP